MGKMKFETKWPKYVENIKKKMRNKEFDVSNDERKKLEKLAKTNSDRAYDIIMDRYLPKYKEIAFANNDKNYKKTVKDMANTVSAAAYGYVYYYTGTYPENSDGDAQCELNIYNAFNNGIKLDDIVEACNAEYLSIVNILYNYIEQDWKLRIVLEEEARIQNSENSCRMWF